jgi:hypothetical protein
MTNRVILQMFPICPGISSALTPGMVHTVTRLYKKVSLHESLERPISFGALVCPNGSRSKRLKVLFFPAAPQNASAPRSTYVEPQTRPLLEERFADDANRDPAITSLHEQSVRQPNVRRRWRVGRAAFYGLLLGLAKITLHLIISPDDPWLGASASDPVQFFAYSVGYLSPAPLLFVLIAIIHNAFLPKTTVPKVNTPPKQRNIIITHWRGEFSLGVSYWINGLFITLILSFSISMVAQALEDNVGSAWWMFLLSGLLFLTVPLTIWQLVGIWRSADRHHLNTGRKGWAFVAKAAVILGSLKAAAGLATAIPMATEYATMAAGDKFGKATFRLVRNGTEMEFAGGISSGLNEEFKKFIEAAPQLRVVHLESSGGRIAEAKAIAELIRQRGLSTYVSSHCESACTYILMAGDKRWAATNAKIGFHPPSFAGLSQSDLKDLTSDELGYFVRNGIGRQFAEKALATSSDKMWYPSTDEMLAAHILTGVATSGQFAASSLASFSDETKARHLLGQIPLYAALSDIYPNETAELTRKFSEGIKIGKSEEEVIGDVQTIVLSLVRNSIPNAENAQVLEYARLFRRYMEALLTVDAETCSALVDPESGAKVNINVNKLIPSSLDQELALKENIIRQSAFVKSKPDSTKAAAELGKLIDIVNKRHPGKSAIWSDHNIPRSEYRTYCVMNMEVYDEIFKLTPERAGNIFRFIYSS